MISFAVALLGKVGHAFYESHLRHTFALPSGRHLRSTQAALDDGEGIQDALIAGYGELCASMGFTAHEVRGCLSMDRMSSRGSLTFNAMTGTIWGMVTANSTLAVVRNEFRRAVQDVATAEQ